MARYGLLLITAIALQALYLWGFARPQAPGFISIDCGSTNPQNYTDSYTIVWEADAGLIDVGRALPVTGGSSVVLSTLRLFDGNQSKYCYTLSNSAVVAGNFVLVRASIWAGITPPYSPANSDGLFRFILIVDADVWQEVEVPYGSTTYYSYEIYTRAQSSAIDVCFARLTPGGDAPFVNALELRPLPSTLSTTSLMNATGVNLVLEGRANDGVLSSMPSIVRYSNDLLDRIWIASTTTPDNVNITNATVTTDPLDRPPVAVLQTAFMGKPFLWITESPLDVNGTYYATFYFAEIDPAVNSTGQRVFNIMANNVTLFADVDVFAKVGSNVGFECSAVVKPNANGVITFNFTPTATSIYPPFIAGSEFFQSKPLNYSAISTSSVVSAIDVIKSALDLRTYAGDPCFPLGYAYNWLNCSGSMITSISLSNYGTGGTIPEAVNNLTSLTEIHMDGNGLHGEIPDLSALASLQVLNLSNNVLNGSIPESLATLTNLRVLDLQNNNLSGDIPAALLQRKQASTLNFTYSGNPFCETNAELGCAVKTTSTPGPASNTPSPAGSTGKKSSMGVIIGVIVAVILVLVVAIAIIYFCLCAKKPSSKVKKGQPAVLDNVIQKSVYEFTYQEIENATNKFSSEIGKGGFGPVYRGTLQDGSVVAVKVASNSSNQGSKEFLNEVGLLSKIHHRNLVGFLGYCNEGKLMLVYEFMANGSLHDCLHGRFAKATPLPWPTRLRIMVDCAQGFEYLHYGCKPRIIHRDVKSSNILLNDKLEAKISDFGISRNTLMNETGATAIMGSQGYMDPEYLTTMRLTEKVDVYSFGVVLFELVCGRPAVFLDSKNQIRVTEWAKSFMDRGIIGDVVDPSLHGKYDNSAVWKVLDVARSCVQFSGDERPTMSDVCRELKEAEQIELQSDHRHGFDPPSVEFNDGGYSSSFAHVTAR